MLQGGWQHGPCSCEARGCEGGSGVQLQDARRRGVCGRDVACAAPRAAATWPCSREGGGDAACAAGRGGSEVARAARRAAATRRPQLGGGPRRGAVTWRDDAARAATRGAATRLVRFRGARKGTDSAKNTAESADKGKELLTRCQSR